MRTHEGTQMVLGLSKDDVDTGVELSHLRVINKGRVTRNFHPPAYGNDSSDSNSNDYLHYQAVESPFSFQSMNI
jgi:hypothetical protein